ncbi:hypothetical protein BDY17DRAFT_183949 [Neohortaea acidophila]|uniref:Uncharacterized protein n=1 Tax=Neohortaea acidophila TaxID=245834 RepID=A0A6A6PNA4_9PEZI|nr:uncharacterized protein BDY17DRAFT_183949 [Neohortaea acidophila]KAF2481171.1 hypothetical protein BDY17DRAFT_183949 [Neohortaea acidophila]
MVTSKLFQTPRSLPPALAHHHGLFSLLRINQPSFTHRKLLHHHHNNREDAVHQRPLQQRWPPAPLLRPRPRDRVDDRPGKPRQRHLPPAPRALRDVQAPAAHLRGPSPLGSSHDPPRPSRRNEALHSKLAGAAAPSPARHRNLRDPRLRRRGHDAAEPGPRKRPHHLRQPRQRVPSRREHGECSTLGGSTQPGGGRAPCGDYAARDRLSPGARPPICVAGLVAVHRADAEPVDDVVGSHPGCRGGREGRGGRDAQQAPGGAGRYDTAAALGGDSGGGRGFLVVGGVDLLVELLDRAGCISARTSRVWLTAGGFNSFFPILSIVEMMKLGKHITS